MKTAIFNWLNHHIRIELPDPEDDNTVYVEIHRQTGTYDPQLYNSYLTDYRFSAESNDPNQWVVEGAKSAIAELSGWGVKFHESKSASVAAVVGEDEDDIPF
jgi:hypothetical protein